MVKTGHQEVSSNHHHLVLSQQHKEQGVPRPLPFAVLWPRSCLWSLLLLCSAWFCCSTSRNRAASESGSPPVRSQTPWHRNRAKPRDCCYWRFQSSVTTCILSSPQFPEHAQPFSKTDELYHKKIMSYALYWNRAEDTEGGYDLSHSPPPLWFALSPRSSWALSSLCALVFWLCWQSSQKNPPPGSSTGLMGRRIRLFKSWIKMKLKDPG